MSEARHYSGGRSVEEISKEEQDARREAQRIFSWRRDELIGAGYPWDYAVRMAKDSEIELHQACELLRKTDDLQLSLEILL